MRPRRLAYLAYFFPPLGGAGVQRSLKFARYLPAHGWSPHVITVREGAYWMTDPSLLDDVPPEVQVTRISAGPLLGRLAGRDVASGASAARRSQRRHLLARGVARFLFVPDVYASWARRASAVAGRILAEGGVLLTTSSPDSAHLAGLGIHRPGVGWVADFRDPWVRRMSYAPPTPIHDAIQRSMERRVVNRASRLVVTSGATRDDFIRRYPKLDRDRIAVIPNGYDEEDFPAQAPEPDSEFRILHAGQLNPDRSIEPLLDALDRFFRLRPEAAQRTWVDFIGARYDSHEESARRRVFARRIRFRDPIPHREAVLQLCRARVLLLLEQESERGSLILPGKTFELIRAGRPVLALVPDGAARDLVGELQAGLAAPPTDPDAAAAHLARLYDLYRTGELGPVCPVGAGIERFERRRLTADLARLLDEVLSTS